MNYFDKEFLKSQKEKLLLEKTRLENKIKQLDKFPQYGSSDEDNAEEVDDFMTSQGQENQMMQMLDDVKNALKKLEEGKYGICANCPNHNLIDKERLVAFPAATLCEKCEEKYAKKQ